MLLAWSCLGGLLTGFLCNAHTLRKANAEVSGNRLQVRNLEVLDTHTRHPHTLRNLRLQLQMQNMQHLEEKTQPRGNEHR